VQKYYIFVTIHPEIIIAQPRNSPPDEL